MGRGFESFRPCQKPKFLLRLYFFAEKWQRRSGLSPEGSPTARKYSRHHRPRKPRTWLAPYFHRAHRPKQLLTVFASLTFRPCQKIRQVSACRIFLSKSQTWYIIRFQTRISRLERVYHQPFLGCISSRFSVYLLRLDEIQHCVLMIYKAHALVIYKTLF